MIPRRKMMRRRVGKMRMEVKQRKKRTRMRRKKKRNVMLPVSFRSLRIRTQLTFRET
jgi:hypothetical protein